MAKKLRVLVLMHEDLVPPDTLEDSTEEEILQWKTEYDVITTLRQMGHDVQPLGVSDDLGTIRKAISYWKPDLAFNLLEEFHGVAIYDQAVVNYLELMRLPYTGCNPRGLLLAHDKAISKQILTYHRIPTPRFVVHPKGRKPKPSRRLRYPILVKSVSEDASYGISQASVVNSDEKLIDRVLYVHGQTSTDALAEEFIPGRELYVGVIGNQRLQTLPIWEMLFSKMPENILHIATRKVKWDIDYQKKHGIDTKAATDLPDATRQKIERLCKRIYRSLHLSGYARMDLRLTDQGKIFFLEANPNPNLSYGEDFAESAEKVGIEYNSLLQKIINLGTRYEAPWQMV